MRTRGHDLSCLFPTPEAGYSRAYRNVYFVANTQGRLCPDPFPRIDLCGASLHCAIDARQDFSARQSRTLDQRKRPDERQDRCWIKGSTDREHAERGGLDGTPEWIS